ncbi:MAG: class I SAM-dependent methyltransferase [Candidatus Hydrogenedentes bacterium]|nr:class I SAM-dependent methyltransferase [Candidatus Hydrogenedentota bacterium]
MESHVEIGKDVVGASVERENRALSGLERRRLMSVGNLESSQRPRLLYKIGTFLLGNDLSAKRLLDVGCGEDYLLRELVAKGAEYVGVEAREENIRRALERVPDRDKPRVHFRQAMAQEVSLKSDGRFDLAFVAGLIYHMSARDQFDLLVNLREMVRSGLVVDTTLTPDDHDNILFFELNGCIYSGSGGYEHATGDSQETIESRLRASYSEDPEYASFTLTRSCLVRLLRTVGFEQVFEYRYSGDVNPFSMPVQLDHTQTVGAFRNTLRRIVVATAAEDVEVTQLGPFPHVPGDGRHGALGAEGLSHVAQRVEEIVGEPETDHEYICRIDDLFQALPVKLYYLPLTYLLARDMPVQIMYRFFKAYSDPVIRIGSAMDRERMLALFSALLLKYKTKWPEVTAHSAESFTKAFDHRYAIDVGDFLTRLIEDDDAARVQTDKWFAKWPVPAPETIRGLCE